jgi:uncharacterized protein
LADALLNMLQGNREFILVDDQKLVFETALNLAKLAETQDKQVLIVEGGPGTGKSVVAINLLVELTDREKVVHYVTKNSAPREVYHSKLTGSFKQSRIKNLFKGSGAYVNLEEDSLDVLVVDEAHRLNKKSGMYSHLGEDQIMEIIRSARLSVFFIDEAQRVTWKDNGRKTNIHEWAEHCGATVTELALDSQFRCNGSDGYLAWIDHVLNVRETANWSLDDMDYDFQVFDDPTAMRQSIVEKNREHNKSRMVAGYCWDWASKKNTALMDIEFPEYQFSMQWNLGSDGGLWIVKPESVNQIGCIHTCQGLELDYVGVIIGPDLMVRDGQVITDATARSKNDSSIKGYKTLLKSDPTAARQKADEIIKNTYRTLMSRGQKGCYIYCTDPETRAYFKQTVSGLFNGTEEPEQSPPYPGLSLKLLDPDDVKPFENAVPIYDISAAAGMFSEEQFTQGQNDDRDWVALPEPFSAKPGYFVARVRGESMNRRIPNGAWCLFRTDPGGSRQGKIVLVQHSQIQDPDNGQFTIKVYHSDKTTSDEDWHHTRITLKPDSNAEGYEDIVLEDDELSDFRVLGEFIAAF